MYHWRQDQQEGNADIETVRKQDLNKFRGINSPGRTGAQAKDKISKGGTTRNVKYPRKEKVPPLETRSQKQHTQKQNMQEQPCYVPSFATEEKTSPRASFDVDSTASDRSKTSPRQNVYERLYDPNHVKMRNKTPPPPFETYYMNFKANIPPSMEHVHSLHRDENYLHRLQEVRDTSNYEEEHFDTTFKSNPPRALQNVQSLHRNPNYLQKLKELRDTASYEEEHLNAPFKSKPPKWFQDVQSRVLDAKKPPQTARSWEAANTNFVAMPPKYLEHVESRILDPTYAPERPAARQQDTPEYHAPEFRARPPRSLEHVQSRILEPRYFTTKQIKEEEVPTAQFRAHPPKKLGHIQSRILDPTYQPPQKEVEEEVYQTEFVANPPKSLQHVESRILEPHYFQPRENKSVASSEDEFDTNFRARIPRGMEHVQSRIYDEKYLKKKTDSVADEDPNIERKTAEFKTQPPKEFQNVKSRVFDPKYNVGKLPPPYELRHELTMEQKGPIVFIKLRDTDDDQTLRPNSDSQIHNMAQDRGKASRYHGYWNKKDADIKAIEEKERPKEVEPQKKNPPRRPRLIRKPKPEKIDRSFFQSFSETPDRSALSSDSHYRQRRRHAEMWDNRDTAMVDSGRGALRIMQDNCFPIS